MDRQTALPRANHLRSPLRQMKSSDDRAPNLSYVRGVLGRLRLASLPAGPESAYADMAAQLALSREPRMPRVIQDIRFSLRLWRDLQSTLCREYLGVIRRWLSCHALRGPGRKESRRPLSTYDPKDEPQACSPDHQLLLRRWER